MSISKMPDFHQGLSGFVRLLTQHVAGTVQESPGRGEPLPRAVNPPAVHLAAHAPASSPPRRIPTAPPRVRGLARPGSPALNRPPEPAPAPLRTRHGPRLLTPSGCRPGSRPGSPPARPRRHVRRRSLFRRQGFPESPPARAAAATFRAPTRSMISTSVESARNGNATAAGPGR